MDPGDRARKPERPARGHWGHAFVLASAVSMVALVMGACSSQSAPSSFTERVVLTSCGEIHLGQGEAVPSDAWVCLDSAAGTGAELVVDMPTNEGDPLMTYYRVGPSIDGLEVFIDTTQDGFGPRAWSHGCVRTRSPQVNPSAARNSDRPRLRDQH